MGDGQERAMAAERGCGRTVRVLRRSVHPRTLGALAYRYRSRRCRRARAGRCLRNWRRRSCCSGRVGTGGRVVGVDLNPGMIAVARSLPAPVGASIEWVERSALDLRLQDATIDVALCQQGLQFFPDKALAMRE